MIELPLERFNGKRSEFVVGGISTASSRIVLTHDVLFVIIALKRPMSVRVPMSVGYNNFERIDFICEIPIIENPTRQQWKVTDEGKTVTVDPSFMNHVPYNNKHGNGKIVLTHFFLKKNRLQLCGDNPFRESDVLLKEGSA